jgi:hypothetical protein
VVHWSAPAETAGRLEALCRREGVPVASGCCALVAGFLRKLSGQTDFAIAQNVDLRYRVDGIADLLGFAVGTVLLRADLSTAHSFSQVLKGVSRELAVVHSRAPFPIVPLLFPSYNELCRVYFNFIPGGLEDRESWHGLVSRPLPESSIPPDDGYVGWFSNLEFNTWCDAGRLGGFITHNAHRWTSETARQWAAAFPEFIATALAEGG